MKTYARTFTGTGNILLTFSVLKINIQNIEVIFRLPFYRTWPLMLMHVDNVDDLIPAN